MPQSIAAIALKMSIPRILTRFGYRNVLLTNTVVIGLGIVVCALVGPSTPPWMIVIEAVVFGFSSSTQYTSMNTLVYADVKPADANMASTMASTVQQMSMSFGVAVASLATALFVPERFTSNTGPMIAGIHKAFLLLGSLTVLSTAVFRSLERGDGDSVSGHGDSVSGHGVAVPHAD